MAVDIKEVSEATDTCSLRFERVVLREEGAGEATGEVGGSEATGTGAGAGVAVLPFGLQILIKMAIAQAYWP